MRPAKDFDPLDVVRREVGKAVVAQRRTVDDRAIDQHKQIVAARVAAGGIDRRRRRDRLRLDIAILKFRPERAHVGCSKRGTRAMIERDDFELNVLRVALIRA